MFFVMMHNLMECLVPPRLPPQPQPVEVATPINHGSTYIQDMFDLDIL